MLEPAAALARSRQTQRPAQGREAARAEAQERFVGQKWAAELGCSGQELADQGWAVQRRAEEQGCSEPRVAELADSLVERKLVAVLKWRRVVLAQAGERGLVALGQVEAEEQTRAQGPECSVAEVARSLWEQSCSRCAGRRSRGPPGRGCRCRLRRQNQIACP